MTRVSLPCLVAAGLVLAGLMAVLPVPAAADSPLKRMTLRQDLLGFEAVGRLDFGRGFCSAALIAPDLVLTAAHCLIEERTGARKDPADMLFRAGYRDGGALAESRGARAVVLDTYRHDDADGLRQLVADIGLVELADPIPAGRISPFALARAPGAGGQVSVVSYAAGREGAPSWQRRCDVLLQGQGALMMTCDTHFGSSGAPVFDMGAGRPRIVSVISRGVREDGKSIVYGMEADAAVAKLKAALRTGRGVWSASGSGTPAPPQRLTLGGEASRTGIGAGSGGARFLRP